jgi:structural maintenance of chromosome 3 (chondroitin sulfate proteoglycan 6)
MPARKTPSTHHPSAHLPPSFSPPLLSPTTVGANGSGKSNFFHAIRFVLSDVFQRTTQEERQQLLHEGAGHAAVTASVEIVFDNADARFPVDRDEVRLRRVIGATRDEYHVDGKHVTKNEVQNLLESAGFSRANPYHVVQQGKITAMATMREPERLELLKEIGGTKVYEERRRETLKILEESQQRKAQFDDSLATIEDNIRRLDEDREELQRYQQLDKQRRGLEYMIYDKELLETRGKLEEVEAARGRIHGRADEVHKGVNDAERQLADAETEAKGLQRRQGELQREEGRLRDRKEEAIRRKARAEIECRDVEVREGMSFVYLFFFLFSSFFLFLVNWRTRQGLCGALCVSFMLHPSSTPASRPPLTHIPSLFLLNPPHPSVSPLLFLQDRLATDNSSLEDVARQLKGLERDIQRKQTELDKAKGELRTRQAREAEAARTASDVKGRLDALYDKQGRSAQFKTAADRDKYLKEEVAARDKVLQGKRRKLEEAQRGAEEARGERDRLSRQISDHRGSLTQREEALAAADEEVSALKRRQAELNERRREAWDQEAALEDKLRERREDLARKERALESTVPADTKRALDAVARFQQEHQLPGVYGTVMDLVQAPPALFLALEVTAGQSLHHVVVDTDQTAARLIQHLNERRAGRLTFVPLNRLQKTHVQYPRQYGQDVVPLVDLIKYDRHLTDAIMQVRVLLFCFWYVFVRPCN